MRYKTKAEKKALHLTNQMFDLIKLNINESNWIDCHSAQGANGKRETEWVELFFGQTSA